MAKVVSLSRVRKTRARDENHKAADANAIKFGRTKGEKMRDRLEAEKSARNVDQHQIDTPEQT